MQCIYSWRNAVFMIVVMPLLSLYAYSSALKTFRFAQSSGHAGGIYNLPSHLSPGARDLIPRMLLVDPLKRITIPEIRFSPQFHKPIYVFWQGTESDGNRLTWKRSIISSIALLKIFQNSCWWCLHRNVVRIDSEHQHLTSLTISSTHLNCRKKPTIVLRLASSMELLHPGYNVLLGSACPSESKYAPVSLGHIHQTLINSLYLLFEQVSKKAHKSPCFGNMAFLRAWPSKVFQGKIHLDKTIDVQMHGQPLKKLMETSVRLKLCSAGNILGSHFTCPATWLSCKPARWPTLPLLIQKL